ncbi:Metal-dependent hydrolase, beta-lactamase superfamily II [Clostridium cavendishii DSM 21758]|uniref:Metal-dependent hydrolase, beta-lactamase superfamily II n=1 Tax=Clostridium cavendishii DSM 21758 TaxID=1121302 RepID=A0A1M6CCU1_9CLOT|nr:MBL fold metallo-hydrolase [Clostridium cavendishii]SHI58816.1 Metal-dependent hydrolase, beta-lactamase superfamily II [Clostridium cavendishii DSM 21758]
MKSINKNKLFILSIVVLFFAVVGTLTNSSIINNKNTVEKSFLAKSQECYTSEKNSQDLKVHFIDVGQGDSILIEKDGEAMLIDAGTTDHEKTVINYIEKQGINKLDVVVATHPHEDHIGGMPGVINTFDIGKMYIPQVSANTRTFERMVSAAKNKRVKFISPVVGDKFNIGNARCTVLAPKNDDYENINDYSIVVKLEYGNTVFLFTGDAQEVSEKEMLKSRFNLKADVLKVGHQVARSFYQQYRRNML